MNVLITGKIPAKRQPITVDRPVLYWTYTVTSYDQHGDSQRVRQPWLDTYEEARQEADDQIAALLDVGHTNIVVTIEPVCGASTAERA